ncbi:MAG: glycosyltransferase family 4 protein [Desulfobacterales bacterium]
MKPDSPVNIMGDNQKKGMPGKKNILVVARWPLGGIRTYMKYVYQSISKEKYRITIVAPEVAESEAFEKDVKRLRLRLIKANTLGGSAGLAIDVFKLLAKEKYSLIQSHGFISALCAFLPGMLFGVPHVLTVHGMIEERLLGRGPQKTIRVFLLKSMIKKVILYAVSNDILQHVMQRLNLGKKEKLAVIHNGVDLNCFENENTVSRERARDLLGLPQGKTVIGFVGRFMPQKGFNYLIDAVDLLRSERKIRQFVVAAVGSGDYLKHYRSEVHKKQLDEYFLFVPFQSDMLPVYKAIDVLVMPSLWEAFPLQPMEAMVNGTPIIVTDCIGLRECVRGTPAVVIPKADPGAIANAISNMKLDQARIEFSNFIPHAQKRFDVRVTARKVENLFDAYSISN